MSTWSRLAPALGALLVGGGLGLAVTAVAVDPPHDTTRSIECISCHSLHGAPGGKLNIAEENPNVCLACHTPGGQAQAKPFADVDQSLPGISGSSHRFDSGPSGHAEPDPSNVGSGKVRTVGTFTGRIETVYTLTITGTGDVGIATFDWVDDQGAGPFSATVGAIVPLNQGINATFENGTSPSFQAGDTWYVYVRTDLRLPIDGDPYEDALFGALEDGKVVCSTCHNQHSQEHAPIDPSVPSWTGPGTGEGRKFQRNTNDQNQMCLVCHSVRDVQSSAGGSHPIKVPLPATAEFTDPTPTLRLINDQVYCSTCHSPHYATSNDGYLLNDSIGSICLNCHQNADFASGSHFDPTTGALWPGGQYGSSFPAHTPEKRGYCVNCHWPHGWPDDDDFANDYPRLWVEQYDLDKVTPGADPDDAEDLCFTCHNATSAATNIRAEFVDNWAGNGSTFRTHPVRDSDQVGYPGTDRSVECVSCHNPHRARPDDKLAGVAGVDVLGNPVGYGTANPRPIVLYELCFRCHASDTSGDTYNAARDSNATPTSDKRLDFSTSNSAFHPVLGAGRNQSQNLADQLSPNGLTTSSTIVCTDCHNSESTSDTTLAADSAHDTKGPHGSTNPYILRGNYSRNYTGQGWNDNNAELCFICHDAGQLFGNGSNFWDNGDGRDNLHEYHLRTKDVTDSCASCHFNVHSNRTANNTCYRVNTGSGWVATLTPPTNVKSHLVNFAPDVILSRTPPGVRCGNTPIWSMDTTNNQRRCWVECHGSGDQRMDPALYRPPSGDDPVQTFTPCTDGDSDGAFSTAGCGTPIDCNDGDPDISPLLVENTAAYCAPDGKDNDCDLVTDCADTDCFGVGGCNACTDGDSDSYYGDGGTCPGLVDCDDGDPLESPGLPESSDAECGDFRDNDCDGLFDCADPDCDGAIPCCTDVDSDTYYAEAICPGAQDCNDSDPDMSPGLVENTVPFCGDTKDNDCDVDVDCADPNCAGIAGCPSCTVENDDVLCGDTLDNDCDTLFDCADPDCTGTVPCCTDGDSDGAYLEAVCPGTVDCDDGDPNEAPGLPENTDLLCADGLDNNCVAGVDCADPACAATTPCSTVPENTPVLCHNGIDDDGDLLTDCDDPDCLGVEPETGAADCSDNVDQDCDGFIDCHDLDCWPGLPGDDDTTCDGQSTASDHRPCCNRGGTLHACYRSNCNGFLCNSGAGGGTAKDECDNTGVNQQN